MKQTLYFLAFVLLLASFGLAPITHASSDVVSQTPVNGSLGVATTSAITVVFDRNITATTTNISFSPTIAFTFATSSATLTITPSVPFSNNTTYTLTLANIKDVDGDVLSSYTSQFTTQNNYSISIYNNANGGLNLVSLPVQPSNTAIASVLGSVASSISSVWSYDPSNPSANSSGWLVYYPTHPDLSNLATMNTGYGYWITTNADATLSGSGSLFTSTSTPPSRTVQPGWNLLGYYQLPGQSNSTSTGAFSSIPGYTTVVGYDNSTGVFKAGSSILPGDAFWLGTPSSGTYYPSYSFSSGNGSATFGTPSATGVLTVSLATDNPVSGIVATASSTTTGVNLLSFNLKAENSDITITDLGASIGVSAGTTVGAVVSQVKLMKGSAVIKTGTINGVTTGTYNTVTFSGVDRTIAKDATEEYWISVDLKNDSGYADGSTVIASTTASALWDVSDTNSDTVIPSASVLGNAQTLIGASIVTATFVSATATKETGTIAGTPDKVNATIVFTLAADSSSDIYMDSVLKPGLITVLTNSGGFAYATTTDSTTGTTTSAILTASDTNTGDSAGAYLKIPAGTSRTFTLTASASAGIPSSAAGIRIVGFNYGTTAATMTQVYSYNLGAFKTSTIPGLTIH